MSASVLKLQDPHDPDSVYLLETLLERCVSARQGGGAFAWATPDGVRLLIRDAVFERFASKFPFDLVLGVDAITTPAALEELRDAEADLRHFSIKVFHSAGGSALFHPKFAWFMEPDGGSLVVGSGNLTNGGLRQNWEAYSVTPLRVTEVDDLMRQWTTWKTKHESHLFAVTAPQVLARAEANERERQRRPSRTSRPEAPQIPPGVQVLVAEIPRAGDRWEQANFDKENYESFFGAKVGTQRRMLFQHVAPDGTLGEVESRPSVEVKSRNWRFELRAASGLPYPSSGRPIGVFLRLRERSFLYALVLPRHADHQALEAYLDATWRGRRDRIRRVRASLGDVGQLASVARLVAAADVGFADAESS